MIIDCDRCAVRAAACVRCAVTFVTESGPARASAPRAVPGLAPGAGSPRVVELDDSDLRALAALADAGLVPPLRYAPVMVKAS